MRYIIVDLEATCWETGTTPARMEIIEIGAVVLPESRSQPNDEFSRFVRPVAEPVLSDFCKKLTSIKQHDVDNAEVFSIVFPLFLGWIGEEPFRLCSWGAYDVGQFKTDCQRHGLNFPATFEDHINLKQAFATWKRIKPCGMKSALHIMGFPLKGQHHRGIDDARNIARIAASVLPHLEQQRG